jgi:hypothetical protein
MIDQPGRRAGLFILGKNLARKNLAGKKFGRVRILQPGQAHAPVSTIRGACMSPTTYTVQMAAAATALKLARDVDDVAATLAALAAMTRLVRLQYGAAKLAS